MNRSNSICKMVLLKSFIIDHYVYNSSSILLVSANSKTLIKSAKCTDMAFDS